MAQLSSPIAPLTAAETLPADAVLKFRSSGFEGPVLSPDDAEYEQARKVFNGMHDHLHPAVVLRPLTVRDVAAAVRWTRETGAPLAVRGGGHGVAGFGTCNGGIVLDLSKMKRIVVDPEALRLRAEGGCTWNDLNQAAWEHRLAVTGGTVGTTGIAGLTLGGGTGYLTPRFGFSCDNLLSMQVVTADGEVLRCSEREHEDLFWALRGGAGNFGVVTEFEFRVHKMPEQILGGVILFELTAEVAHRYRDWSLGNPPEEMGCVGMFTNAPPLPFVQPEFQGKPALALVVCWSGDHIADGERVVAQIETWGHVVGKHVGPMPYPAINSLFDPMLPAGLRHYWKGVTVRELPNEAIDVYVRYTREIPAGTMCQVHFLPAYGAANRYPVESSAFPFRNAFSTVALLGVWTDPAQDQACIDWVRRMHKDLVPYSDPTTYVNLMPRETAHLAKETFGPNLERLRRVKAKYDPTNVFRLTQNVQPVTK